MALRETLERVRSDIADGHANGANEQEAKDWFITPILQALGWRGPGRVRLELPAGRERVKMDFALQGPDRKSVAFIEAKVPGAELSSHVGQVMNYAFYEGVDICVLTTGVEWWLFLPRESGEPMARRFAVLDLQADEAVDDLEDCLQSCLGYDELVSGAAKERAQQMLEDRRNEERILAEIPKAWRQLLEEPDDLLLQLVQDRVDQSIGLRPTHEQVRNVLRRSIQGAAASHPSSQQPPADPRPAQPLTLPHPPRRERRASRRPSTRIAGFRLWGERHQVSTSTAMWYGVASAVYARHPSDFERAFQLRGTTRQYVALTGDHMNGPRQLPNSPYFIEMNFNASDCERYARELLGLFGYPASDLDVLKE